MKKNKVVIVTGGAGLLGRSIVKELACKEYIVVLTDLNISENTAINKKFSLLIEEEKVLLADLDITCEKSIEKAVKYVHEYCGRIDCLINNAYPRNSNYGRDFFDVTYDDFCGNVSMHLGGYFLVSQKVSRYFLEQGWGNIINLASIYGVVAPRFDLYQGLPMTTPVEYAAIKSAVIHLTKYMASYFKGRCIRVNSISPGGIEDGQSSEFLKRYQEQCFSKGMLSPEDITGAIAFLLDDQSQYINGHNLVVDDGFTV